MNVNNNSSNRSPQKPETEPPSSEDYPFFLEVDSNTPPSDSTQSDAWACLWRHEPEKPISDANPYPVHYMQAQTINDPDDIANEHVRIHQIPREQRNGWKTGPDTLWDFFEALKSHYESNIDEADDLPFHIELTRPSPASDTDGHTIHFHDAEGCEYLIWTSDELYPQAKARTTLIQKSLLTVALAYEDPRQFADRLLKVD